MYQSRHVVKNSFSGGNRPGITILDRGVVKENRYVRISWAEMISPPEIT